MTTIEILKELDRIACKANTLWNQCESLKMRIAENSAIPMNRLKEHGIHIPEPKEESNAKLTGKAGTPGLSG